MILVDIHQGSLQPTQEESHRLDGLQIANPSCDAIL